MITVTSRCAPLARRERAAPTKAVAAARGGPLGRASGRAKIRGARPRAISDPAEEEEDEVSVASGVADAAADEKKTSWGFLSPFGASSAVLEASARQPDGSAAEPLRPA